MKMIAGGGTRASDPRTQALSIIMALRVLDMFARGAC